MFSVPKKKKEKIQFQLKYNKLFRIFIHGFEVDMVGFTKDRYIPIWQELDLNV